MRKRDISVWDVKAQRWGVFGERYGVMFGGDSRDVRLRGVLDVETVY